MAHPFEDDGRGALPIIQVRPEDEDGRGLEDEVGRILMLATAESLEPVIAIDPWDSVGAIPNTDSLPDRDSHCLLASNAYSSSEIRAPILPDGGRAIRLP